jgi:phosphoribosyl 1,2-cyclic phosphodiesterase/DNA-binding response OmpR family regulator
MAKAGPSTVRYGGNTSCIEVRSNGGTLLVLDCGTGLHGLGANLMASGAVRGHILIGHTHWDHIQGFPFFTPLFVPGNEWDVYAPRGFGASLRESLAGQMHHRYFPVGIEALGANIRYHDLLEGHFQVGDLTIHAQYLNHTSLTLGYRIEGDGVTVVYSCDHEPHAHGCAAGEAPLEGGDRRHAEFLRGADLVIHDAQYTPEEYAKKIGWGHATPQYAIAACKAAGARRLALTHHDPSRTDDDLDRVLAGIEGLVRTSGVEVFAAAEGMTIELAPVPNPDRWVAEQSSLEPVRGGLLNHEVLLVTATEGSLALASAIASEDAVPLIARGDLAGAVEHLRRRTPSVVVLDHALLGESVADACRDLRAAGLAADVPILVLADAAVPPRGDAFAECLVRPFSKEFLRAKLRAWLLRTTCRWMRAPAPPDETARLETLRALGLLDTAPDARFDRITTLAAEAFQVPIALVSLVDENRQWFKSCVGLDASETSREVAFCAHAILERDLLVVPDAHADARFADNPLVTGAPHVRFYAGVPLRVGGATPIGTLCLIDTRPRVLEARQLELLRSLGAMVERELALTTT